MQDHHRYQPAWNFLGLLDDISRPENAKAWVLPVPFESTTCYGAGTREGPAAIIAASRQVELYDHEFGCEPVMKYGVHTMNPIALVHASPERMADAIEREVKAIFSGSPRPKLLTAFGGEHSISAGTARAMASLLPRNSLVCVQIDAHADLRDSYEGSTFSHACAARRIADSCPLFQIGIRNISAEEIRFCRGNKRVTIVFSEESSSRDGAFLKKLARFVKGKNVFLTIDLDGLDPSIMPSVGTPEPGGILWDRMLDIAKTIVGNAKSLPVFDVVELAPIPTLRAPDFLAAKLAYKIMSLELLKHGKRR